MREEGFTLIEALVALALGAMVLASVLSTVKVAAQGAERARVATADAESFARAGTILAGDAAHALFVGNDAGHPLFLGRSDEVMLPEVPRDPGPQGMPRGAIAVVYHIAQGTHGAVLTRTEAPLINGRIGDMGPQASLWQTPGRLEFRFLDAGGSWQREWTSRTELPRALAVADPGEGTPRLASALPDLLPMACATGPGPACPLAAEDFP